MAWNGQGSTRQWRKTRARILVRDGQVCQLRLEGCTGRATEVHHVLGKGISEMDAHLKASCQSCNNAVGDPTKAGDPAPIIRTQW